MFLVLFPPNKLTSRKWAFDRRISVCFISNIQRAGSFSLLEWRQDNINAWYIITCDTKYWNPFLKVRYFILIQIFKLSHNQQDDLFHLNSITPVDKGYSDLTNLLAIPVLFLFHIDGHIQRFNELEILYTCIFFIDMSYQYPPFVYQVILCDIIVISQIITHLSKMEFHNFSSNICTSTPPPTHPER